MGPKALFMEGRAEATIVYMHYTKICICVHVHAPVCIHACMSENILKRYSK